MLSANIDIKSTEIRNNDIQSLGPFLHKRMFCDGIILIKSKEGRVEVAIHKVILASSCSFFNSIFSDPSNSSFFWDVDQAEAIQIIEWIYNRKISLTIISCWKLLALAQSIDFGSLVLSLKRYIFDYIYSERHDSLVWNQVLNASITARTRALEFQELVEHALVNVEDKREIINLAIRSEILSNEDIFAIEAYFDIHKSNVSLQLDNNLLNVTSNADNISEDADRTISYYYFKIVDPTTYSTLSKESSEFNNEILGIQSLVKMFLNNNATPSGFKSSSRPISSVIKNNSSFDIIPGSEDLTSCTSNKMAAEAELAPIAQCHITTDPKKRLRNDNVIIEMNLSLLTPVTESRPVKPLPCPPFTLYKSESQNWQIKPNGLSTKALSNLDLEKQDLRTANYKPMSALSVKKSHLVEYLKDALFSAK